MQLGNTMEQLCKIIGANGDAIGDNHWRQRTTLVFSPLSLCNTNYDSWVSVSNKSKMYIQINNTMYKQIPTPKCPSEWSSDEWTFEPDYLACSITNPNNTSNISEFFIFYKRNLWPPMIMMIDVYDEFSSFNWRSVSTLTLYT